MVKSLDLTLDCIGGTESYEDVKKYLYKIIHAYWAKYGGEWYEIVSLVNESFMDAYVSYNPDKGYKLITWIGFKVMKGLLQHRRIMYKDNQRQAASLEDVPGIAETVAQPAAPTFKLKSFLHSLSEDARIVASLVFDIDSDEDKPQQKRSLIRRTLRSWGWSAEQIKSTFSEIADALRS